MDELRQVDLLERIRQHVLSTWSGAEDFLRGLSVEPGSGAADREAEALLAALGRSPLAGAQARRRLLQRREALAQGFDAAAALGMTRGEIERAQSALRQLAVLQSERGTARVWADQFDGPASLLAGLRQSLPALRGQDRWRFLRSVGAAVVVPERRRQTLLERLGLLRASLEETGRGENWAEQHDICLTLASLVSEPVAAIDFLLGAFSGGEPGLPAEVSVCTRLPQCPRCPLQTLCEYYRHRGGGAPAPHPTLKSLPVADRPREKLAARGVDALTDSELLAIILRSGAVGGGTALDLAARLLARFESPAGLARAGIAELCEIAGVGPAKAAEILAALELGRRSGAAPRGRGMQWNSSEEIARALTPRLATLEHEEFLLLLLDTRLRLIREVTVSRGDLTGATVHPREVFKQAIRESAAAVVAVHNHPSGDPTPSYEDREITQQLVAAGEIVGIRLLDHIIIGAEGHVSFADRGWL
jgi:DNA repair protein RadC